MMSPSKMLEETWRWKEEVAREVETMTRNKQIRYFHEAGQRLSEKTGKTLNLPKIAAEKKKTTKNH
jgi:hypothetical protein